MLLAGDNTCKGDGKAYHTEPVTISRHCDQIKEFYFKLLTLITMKQWILFSCLTAFSIYWVVNLVLWFPWSYSPTLGITLMLTVSPLIWSWGIFESLATYPEKKFVKGAVVVSLIYILIAVIADYIFFGIIRHAIKDLYRPTTFYGYGFLVSLPFIIVLLFRKRLAAYRSIKRRNVMVYGTLGLTSLLVIFAVIKLGIAA
jgi:hypothetical protein